LWTTASPSPTTSWSSTASAGLATSASTTKCSADPPEISVPMSSARVLRMRITIALNLALVSLSLAPAARADRRTLIRAYEYMTQPQGNLELDIWNDVDAPKEGGFDQAATLHRVERDYGVTDNWDVALYQLFAQRPGASLEFDSCRLAPRY